jgi:hypothetical protein
MNETAEMRTQLILVCVGVVGAFFIINYAQSRIGLDDNAIGLFIPRVFGAAASALCGAALGSIAGKMIRRLARPRGGTHPDPKPVVSAR